MTDPFRAASSAMNGDSLVPLVGLLLARLEGRVRPARWTATGFGRRVEGVRVQLAPIVAADLLEQSYRREAAPTEPVRVAYAIRWLELTERRDLPIWPEIVPAA